MQSVSSLFIGICAIYRAAADGRLLPRDGFGDPTLGRSIPHDGVCDPTKSSLLCNHYAIMDN